MQRAYRTVEEWETLIGEQIRAERIAANLRQVELAASANVSVGALSSLERGMGSSLKTVVATVKALGRTDWLEALAPPISVSPMKILRAKRGSSSSRVRNKATGAPDHGVG